MKTNKELLNQLFGLFEQFEKIGINVEDIYDVHMYNGIIDINLDRDVMIDHYEKFIELGFQDSTNKEPSDMFRDNIEIFLG